MIEQELWSDKCTAIVGVDEVGRGAAAGPVMVVAVLIPFQWQNLHGVKDSKKLSATARENIRNLVLPELVDVAIAFRDPSFIDAVNIRTATLQAMYDAVNQILSRHNVDLVLVDGRDKIPNLSIPQIALVGGDDKSLAIATASIIAKVERDTLMTRLDEEYQGRYRWASNKGYLTKEHSELIRQHGLTSQHRKSFVKQLINPSLFSV